MALQDPIDPETNNEPLHGEAAVDQGGRFLPWFRNWLERKRLQIGEIISGVNRNAANIVQLETDYQAADGAISTAYIAADAVVAANAESANATLSTTLTAAYVAADSAVESNANLYTDAQILTEQGVRASADSAIASDVTTLTARVGGSEASLIKNAFFQEEFSGTAAPPEWPSWLNGLGTWTARTFGDGYGYQITGAAGVETGNIQNVTVSAGKKYLISGEIRRTGGTLAGAGVFVAWRNSGGSAFATDQIVFATEADTSGVISASPDGPTRWEKEVTAPTGAVTASLYPMTHYSSFGSIAVENSMVWRECNLAPLTNAQAQSTVNAASIVTNATAIATETSARAAADTTLTASVNGVSATVTTQGTAIADIEGNLSAAYAVIVDANGRIASLRLLSDGTTATAELLADLIYMGDDTVFEDTQNSFVTETGGNRYRYGGPFGASDDLLQWFGPDSVAQGSEARTNGFFAFGTDGKVYYGTAELTTGDPLTVTTSLDQSTYVGSVSPQVTASVTITASGGSSPYTYAWTKVTGDTFTVTSPTAASTTFSTSADNQTDGEQAIYRCTVTDDDGNKASIDVGVLAIYIAPP